MTTSVTASLQSPIDEEIIKTEEVVPSSSNNVTPNDDSFSSSVNTIDIERDVTDIRVKKEEEEVDDDDDDDDNSHDDGTSTRYKYKYK
jgi:hypothetical protein